MVSEKWISLETKSWNKWVLLSLKESHYDLHYCTPGQWDPPKDKGLAPLVNTVSVKLTPGQPWTAQRPAE